MKLELVSSSHFICILDMSDICQPPLVLGSKRLIEAKNIFELLQESFHRHQNDAPYFRGQEHAGSRATHE